MNLWAGTLAIFFPFLSSSHSKVLQLIDNKLIIKTQKSSETKTLRNTKISCSMNVIPML